MSIRDVSKWTKCPKRSVPTGQNVQKETSPVDKRKEKIKMAKRGGFPGGMGGFGGMNINSLMKEAKKMQADMERSQVELASKEFEASAGDRKSVV